MAYMKVDMVANMKVDKVVNMKVVMVADMKVEMVSNVKWTRCPTGEFLQVTLFLLRIVLGKHFKSGGIGLELVVTKMVVEYGTNIFELSLGASLTWLFREAPRAWSSLQSQAHREETILIQFYLQEDFGHVRTVSHKSNKGF